MNFTGYRREVILSKEKVQMQKGINMFRNPNNKEWFYLLIVVFLYLSGVVYVYAHDLSIAAFKYGLLQAKGITGTAARLTERDCRVCV